MPKIDPACVFAALDPADKATLLRWQQQSGFPWHIEEGLVRYLTAVAIRRDAAQEFNRHPDPDFPERADRLAHVVACRRLGVSSRQFRQWIRRWVAASS